DCPRVQVVRVGELLRGRNARGRSFVGRKTRARRFAGFFPPLQAWFTPKRNPWRNAVSSRRRRVVKFRLGASRDWRYLRYTAVLLAPLTLALIGNPAKATKSVARPAHVEAPSAELLPPELQSQGTEILTASAEQRGKLAGKLAEQEPARADRFLAALLDY